MSGEEENDYFLIGPEFRLELTSYGASRPQNQIEKFRITVELNTVYIEISKESNRFETMFASFEPNEFFDVMRKLVMDKTQAP